jgi:hypothetical protein
MRTTIRLDEHLLRQVKDHAVKTGRTMTAVIEDALRAFLGKKRTPKSKRRIKLATFKGRGLQPGVDLDSTAELLDRMDRSDAVD